MVGTEAFGSLRHRRSSSQITFRPDGQSYAYYKVFGSVYYGVNCTMKVLVDYGPKLILAGETFYVITAYARKGTTFPF